jgi:hypothetical protein
MRALFSISSVAALLAAAPANTLCFYTKADLFAGMARSYTTLAQEFRDSRWVVRARVISARYHSTESDSWTVYTVRVLDRFKGPSIRTMRVFTYRDSGGFYLDKGLNVPDRANAYLLFLNPATQDLPRGMRNVVQVNFSCGQSRPWKELTRADRSKLDFLAGRSRR